MDQAIVIIVVLMKIPNSQKFYYLVCSQHLGLHYGRYSEFWNISLFLCRLSQVVSSIVR